MAVAESGSGELLVTGYAEHNFYAPPGRHTQISAAHSFLGLQWRLEAYMLIDLGQPANDMGIHPLFLHGCIHFEDPGEQGAPTVYSARVKLSILLPNGQLVAERQDQVRHRFSRSSFTIDQGTNPELAAFLGHPGQLLTESFIFKADIEACSKPTILHSPNYHHAIEVGPFEKGNYCSIFVSGYVNDLRRLVFWIVTAGRVSYWAVNPLVPSSLERLCRRETELRDVVSGAAGLSQQQHLAACVTADYFRSLHFHIMVLGTGKLLHRRYASPANFPYSEIRGLAHTRRGWIMFTTRAFYLLSLKSTQIELLMLFDADAPPKLSVNYNSLLASYHNENSIQVWDLGSAELNSQTYDHQLTLSHSLYPSHDKMLIKEELQAQAGGWQDRALLSRMELEDNHCRTTPSLLILHSGDAPYLDFDGEKLFVVRRRVGNNEMVVQTVWLPGQIPTAKELATMKIQKQTGKQRMIQTALGDKSVWRGGLTEDMLRETLGVKLIRQQLLGFDLAPKLTAIMN